MADRLHLTAATVEKHLSALVGKGLVAEDDTFAFKCETGKFFTLPNEVFLLALPPSAFLVYAYLLYREDRCTHQCHPSYRTIAGVTGLSMNMVVKSVGVLTDKGLITVERSTARLRAERRLSSVTRRHPTAVPCGPSGYTDG